MDMNRLTNVFPTEDSCLKYLELVLWKDDPTCPYCHSKKYSPLPKKHRYHCNTCNTSFSPTVGTIFHKSHIPLQKWFLALYISKHKHLSIRKLAAMLEINKNTAANLLKKIKHATPEQMELINRILETEKPKKIKNSPKKTTFKAKIKRFLGM